MKHAESHFVRTAIATTWNYSGRVIGLGWTVLLVAQLGIGEYGSYAIGIAAAAIINAALDNPFYVRSLRVDEDHFERERSARVVFGALIAIVGIVTFAESYVAGFAIMVAAGELFFNTFKSQYMRVGRPDVAMRCDAIRQVTSVSLAASYLFVAHDPHLGTATALYVIPYGAIAILCLKYIPGRKPACPGDFREMSILSSEAFAAAVYAQGDLLILGLIAGETVTGYYSVVLVTASALSTVGQNYATTFVAHLRGAGGDLRSAPRPWNVLKVGLLTACTMAAAAAAILVSDRADDVAYLGLIMSVWVGARAIQYNFIVILLAQHRDVLRVRATATAAAAKVALLFPMVHLLGGYGAALTAVLCELALTAVYFRAIYRSPVVNRGAGSVAEVSQ